MSDPLATLNQLADEVLAIEKRLLTFSADDPDEEDLASHFADLHAHVSHAYENYQSGSLPTEITYTNDDGEEAKPGEGVPTGLPIDIVEILFATLALARYLKVDIGQMVMEVGKAKKKFALKVESERAADEQDLDDTLGDDKDEDEDDDEGEKS